VRAPAINGAAMHVLDFEPMWSSATHALSGKFSLQYTMASALLNGPSMHVLDFEPMWTPSNHALFTTLPAILALAETRGVSGREVITALVKDIELQGWVRHAGHLDENGSIRAGMHHARVARPGGKADLNCAQGR
jgi:2-methylcitrate dehydratase PrpD